MKNNTLLLTILIVALLIVGYLFIPPAMKQYALKQNQEELAKNLGVRIQDYPDPRDFPVGYFDMVLKPQMTYDEVHHIVRGYAMVYNCYGIDELYYYFSKDTKDAIRFRLTYDDHGRLVKLEGEDSDSRTLRLSSDSSVGALDN